MKGRSDVVNKHYTRGKQVANRLYSQQRLAMVSGVIETKDKVIVGNVPKAEWGKLCGNSFVKAVQTTLGAVGEKYSYDFLMGVSGAAFRLQFKPGWCSSSIDAITGFDVSQVLFESIGYSYELCAIEPNSVNGIKALHHRIAQQIDRGTPVIAGNLDVCPEWGVILGYMKNKSGIVCRTFNDIEGEHALTDRAPWITYLIGEQKAVPDTKNIFKKSLELAVFLAKTQEFGDYRSGFAAFDMWIEELTKKRNPGRNTRFVENEDNHVILDNLIDARQAAVHYLTDMNAGYPLKKGNLIIDNYKNEVEVLKEVRTNVLPPFDSGMRGWATEVVQTQLDLLAWIRIMEKETIGLIEEELSALK